MKAISFRKAVIGLIVVVVIVAVCAAFFAGRAYLRYLDKTRKAQQMAQQREARAAQDVHDIIDRLKVGPEGIYCNGQVSYKINQLRRYVFQKAGIWSFFPYINQIRPGNAAGISRMLSPSESTDLNNRNFDLLGSYFRFRPERYGNSLTVEHNWFVFATRACGNLAFAFRQKNETYDYLKQHWDLYEKEIRPRLFILADSSNTWLAYKALDALTAAGERSDYIKDRLSYMACRHPSRRDGVLQILSNCGYDAPPLWPTLDSLPVYGNGQPDGRKDSSGTPLSVGVTARANFTLPPRSTWPSQSYPIVLGALKSGQTIYLRQGADIYRMDIGTGKVERIAITGIDARAAALSGDGKTLAVYGKNKDKSVKRDCRLILWDIASGAIIGEFPLFPPYDRIQWLRFHPTCPRLIASEMPSGRSNVGCVCVYDVTQRQQLLYRFPMSLVDFFPGSLKAMVLFPPVGKSDGMVMIGIGDGRLRVWNEDNRMKTEETNPLIKVEAIAMSHDAKTVAAVSRHRLRVWELHPPRNTSNGDSVFTLRFTSILCYSGDKERSQYFTSTVFSPDDKWLLTTHDGSDSIVIWNRRGQPIARLVGHAGRVIDIQFVGDKLVSTGEDAAVLVWDWPEIIARYTKKS